MFYAIAALVFIVSISAYLLRKNQDTMIGGGMGLNNNERWGMNESDREYHE